MARYICTLNGSRGRTIHIYDKKCVIETAVTIGSVMTHNATDGIKTIFYKDCTGIQFKRSGIVLGYLQFETPSMQMNNQNSNLFSENTFTFEWELGEQTNGIMENVYDFVCDCVESIKYGTPFPDDDMKSLAAYLDKYGVLVNHDL